LIRKKKITIFYGLQDSCCGGKSWRAQKPSNYTFTEYTTLEEYVESVFGVQSTFLLTSQNAKYPRGKIKPKQSNK